MSEIPQSLSPLRRIVTAHNERGNPIIQVDSLISPQASNAFEDIRTAPLWVTADWLPTDDNNTSVDGALRKVSGLAGLVEEKGTNFQYTDLAPGAVTPHHRTNSIDYNILIQGEVIFLDGDTEKHLKNPGDVVITKGTMHSWRNPGGSWARWVTVLIAANPAVVDGKPLEPVWNNP